MEEKNEYLPLPKGFSTAAIHAHQNPDQWSSMAVVAPLVTSTTYKQYSPANFKEFEYSRSGNPTRQILEKTIATLENGKFGLCFSSGLGATTSFAGIFSAGDHILCCDDVYGGTNRLFNKVFTKFNIEVSFVDAVDLTLLENAIKKNTKAIWIETPTNPTLKVFDISAISAIAHKHGLLSVVDNTFLTPYLQRPLDLGADVVVHSVSKYLNGHADVIMGALVVNQEDLYEKFKFNQNAMGIVPSPVDCHQVTRSLKTLAIRMRQHNKSGLQVAYYLQKHPKVEGVLHPGLATHPQFELFKKQTCGHSGVFSFYIRGGLEESKTFLSALNVFTLAESLGGYESLAELPAVMTHASVPEEMRKKLKIGDNLVRISVGLEEVEDLIADLEQAFAKI